MPKQLELFPFPRYTPSEAELLKAMLSKSDDNGNAQSVYDIVQDTTLDVKRVYPRLDSLKARGFFSSLRRPGRGGIVIKVKLNFDVLRLVGLL